jgi:hypothetical protein
MGRAKSMYGLPAGVDLSFLVGATLIQLCVGENELILNLHPDISVMVASVVEFDGLSDCVSEPGDPSKAILKLLPLLGHEVAGVRGSTDGTLEVLWDTGERMRIMDSWREFESYTIRQGDHMIVV